MRNMRRRTAREVKLEAHSSSDDDDPDSQSTPSPANKRSIKPSTSGTRRTRKIVVEATSSSSSESETGDESVDNTSENRTENGNFPKRVDARNDTATASKRRKLGNDDNGDKDRDKVRFQEKGRNSKRTTPSKNDSPTKRRKLQSDKSTCSQSSQQSSSFSQSQRPLSLPGVIKSLHLQNFMCHSNFTHEFHRNLNFITGQNGSGKSALLSGILVALGGKASITSRTSSLKSLIQKGKNTCRVAVTLLNKNGLRKYGDEITIERWVNASGSGGYRIKSVGGEEDSVFNWRPLKKHELDSILIGLNIQIDNPVAILNQEVARSFLRSKDPKVKFDLFYNGTLLSKLESTLQETQSELSETKEILTTQASALRDMHAEITNLQLKCEKISELNQIKDKLSSIHHEYVWSIVIDEERMIETIKAKIATVQKEIDLLTASLRKTEEAYSNLSEESLIEEQDQVRLNLAAKKRELDDIRTQINDTKKNITLVRAKLKTATNMITSQESKVQRLEAQIEHLKAEQDARVRQETNEDETKQSELVTQRKHLEATSDSLKADAENFRLAGDQERDKLQELDANARKLRVEIDSKKRGIQALSNTVNKYSVFGPQMEQLMVKVQANMHRFRKPPRGPLGACFTVKDSKYVVLVEGILQNHLESFVVDNARDLNILRELMDSVYGEKSASQRLSRQSGGTQNSRVRMPAIIICEFGQQMHNISRHKAVHSKAPTILDLLQVENNDHVVINALIDIGEVERILLFSTNTEASNVMKDESSCPRTLKTAYTLQWFRFTPAPKFAARVMKIKQRADILRSGKGREHQVAELKSEVESLEIDLRNLEPTRAEIQAQERTFRSAYNGKSQELSGVRRQLGEIMNEIKRVANKIKEREKHSDLSSYYEELEELREDVKTQVSVRDATTIELESYRPVMAELESKRRKADKKFEELSATLSGFEEARDKLKSRKIELDNVLKKIRARLVSLEATKTTLKTELETGEATLEEKTSSAAQVCPNRIETSRTSTDLQKEFEDIKVRIRETESQLGDVTELQRRLKELRVKYKAMMKDYSPLKNFFKILTSITESQLASFDLLKTHMGRTLTLFFSAMAKQRGYEGRLLVDFATKELYYFVCPDGDSASKTLKAIDSQSSQRYSSARSAEQIKQNKTLKKALVEYSLGLSGGERSFATICFIMALWQVMECPFYMLDEFDVFMDAFNRKTSQVALIAHAKKFSQNQYVLFTPLDLNDVPGADEACVLRLFPPVRGKNGPNTGAGGSQAGGSQAQSDGAGGAPSENIGNGGRQASPGESVENIDPMSSRGTQGKGAARGTTKGRRQIAAANVMGVLQ